ncbi:hypothetical protein MTR_4g097190 [Medicago truncatula]|uniref:Uncharacterized protein n=1 Tax=Medicago truncatula TaxID=3880 RepID=G7JF66_MEDTR|nr:hypothetical protein MTR_4g097190 [Medicago truncatula]
MLQELIQSEGERPHLASGEVVHRFIEALTKSYKEWLLLTSRVCKALFRLFQPIGTCRIETREIRRFADIGYL